MGPACWEPEVLKELVRVGMNVARLNFSHGDYDSKREAIKRIRALEVPVKILGDLCGPKIRVRGLKESPVMLVEGSTCVLTGESLEGTSNRFSVSYDRIHEDVNSGMTIYLRDGTRALHVESIEGKEIICKVILGGALHNGNGVNIPDAHLSISAITEKDKEDIKFMVSQDLDMVAISFVRGAEHIAELRELLKEAGKELPVVSKIETLQALKNIEEIIQASDVIMVARGDLGVEVGFELVPKYQKEIIALCNKAGKPVIVATEMMKTMTDNETPSRAEVSDVANAILDGATAVMTSGETAIGKYPVQTVAWMKKIIDVYKK